MALTSVIQPYDDAWPERYAEEAGRLAPVFAPALLDMHHVGSTAVPQLAAKPEIDILAVVDPARLRPDWPVGLTALGYQQGRDLSPGHRFFRRNLGGVRTHKLHVCDAGHPRVDWMLRFRDHLRTDPADRAAYEALKLRLERDNTEGIGEYLAGKAPFIDAVMARVGDASFPESSGPAGGFGPR